MRILAVDDEKLMLESLCDCIREAAPDAELVSFGSASKACAMWSRSMWMWHFWTYGCAEWMGLS